MDFTNDSNPSQYKALLGLLKIPTFVKSASSKDYTSLPASSFADTIKREYPMGTPEDTWRSYVYLKTASNLSDEKREELEEKLCVASTAHGIEDQFAEIDATAADFDQIKTASWNENTKFALVIDDVDKGEERKYFPINTLREIQDANRNLASARNKMPSQLFKRAAENIYNASIEAGMSEKEIPELVKVAGIKREPDFEYALKVAEGRKRWTDEDGVELYRDVVKAASEDPENLDAYIDLFEELDQGFNVKYSSLNEDPYCAFYSGIESDEFEKVANEHILVFDEVVPIEAFTKLASRVRTYFNKKIASEIEALVSEDNNAKITTKLAQLDTATQKKLLRLLIDSSSDE